MFGNNKDTGNVDVFDITMKALKEVTETSGKIRGVVENAVKAYDDAARAYYDTIEKDVAERRERWNALNQSVELLDAERSELNNRLGEALVTGDTRAEKEAEEKLMECEKKLADLEQRKRIFVGAKAPTGSNVLYAEVEKKWSELEKVAEKYKVYCEALQKARHEARKTFDELCDRSFSRTTWNDDGMISSGMEAIRCNIDGAGLVFLWRGIEKYRKYHEGAVTMKELL